MRVKRYRVRCRYGAPCVCGAGSPSPKVNDDEDIRACASQGCHHVPVLINQERGQRLVQLISPLTMPLWPEGQSSAFHCRACWPIDDDAVMTASGRGRTEKAEHASSTILSSSAETSWENLVKVDLCVFLYTSSRSTSNASLLARLIRSVNFFRKMCVYVNPTKVNLPRQGCVFTVQATVVFCHSSSSLMWDGLRWYSCTPTLTIEL